jgi:hypothetical protein
MTEASPPVSFAADVRFHVAVWRGVAGGVSLRDHEERLARFLEAAGRPRAVVIVIDHSSHPPEKADRERIGAMVRKISLAQVTPCVVVTTKGIVASVQRSVIAAISFFSSREQPLLVGQSLDDVISRLDPELQRHGAELHALVATARAAWESAPKR